MKQTIVMFLLIIFASYLFGSFTFAQNEVIPESNTEVIIRKHPKTGDEFISIVDKENASRQDLRAINSDKYSRPDYRLLDPKVRSGEIPYDGPYSSKKKIYILAASLATIGVVGGATLPVAATTAAAGTGSGIGVGTGAVAVTGAATAAAVIKLDSEVPDDYRRIQETTLLETKSDFYQMHILKNDTIAEKA